MVLNLRSRCGRNRSACRKLVPCRIYRTDGREVLDVFYMDRRRRVLRRYALKPDIDARRHVIRGGIHEALWIEERLRFRVVRAR